MKVTKDGVITSEEIIRTEIKTDVLDEVDLELVSGRTYGSQMLAATGQGQLLTADRIYAVPFQVHKQTTFDEMGINITTQVGSSNAICGVYSNNAGLPASKLAQTVNIDTDVSPDGVSGVFDGSDLVLNPGIYWLVIVSDSAIGVQIASLQDNQRWMGLENFGAEETYSHVYGTFDYSGTEDLPNTFPTPTLSIESAPDIRIKVA